MMFKKRINLITLMFLLISVFSFAGGDENAAKFGLLTLLPPIVAIVLAFMTKNVVLSLFIGIYSGTFLLNIQGKGFFFSFIHGFLDIIKNILGSLSDSWNAGIVLQVLTIGGLVALVSKMGGAKAIAESLAKRAKSPVSAQIITWILGIFIFFDDYANALIVGPIMRPITDKMKISREKLAFVIDATAAPIAGIAIISTWIGYEISLIKDGFSLIGIENINAYAYFVQTIPYRFYNILMLAFIPMSAIMMREFGPMLKAENRARTTGKVLAHNAKPMISAESTALEPDENVKLNVWNAIIPIGTLIISAFVGFYFNGLSALEGDVLAQVQASPLSMFAIRETFGASDASIVLFEAALFASIVAIIMGISQKIFNINDAIDTWVHGMKSLVITGVILLLAWSLSSVIKELGTSVYLVNLASNSIPKFLLPAIIFILGSGIAFATGTSYGTMGILMPLAIPLANAIGQNAGLSGDAVISYIIVTIGAVLTGAVFGDHCSPISDTTILSSMGSACDHIDHTKTQLIYALAVGALAVVFGYIPAGMGLSIYIVLPVAILSVYLLLLIFGKKIETA
ncbi:MAG: Na+/H+ antiporter NhaC family protein [Fusobacteriales bacterium]|nr:Na+/H+ antiporter NhaC family protein [Fusobacteriales bacterium]